MSSSQSRKITVALILTLLALGLHFYLAQQHYALKFGTSAGNSICSVSETLNCDAVAASSYSVILGIPVAVWGVAGNALLFLLLLIYRSGWTDTREKVGRYAAWMATGILAASVLMGTISLVFMSKYCLFCIAAYVISLIVFYCVVSAARPILSHLGEDLASLVGEQKWVLICMIAVPAGAYLGNLSIHKQAGFGQMRLLAADKVAMWKTSPTNDFDTNRGLVMEPKGPARMTIVEFADFRCPHCKHASPSLHTFAKAHDDVRFVFKAYPLDGVCNPALTGMGGDGISCRIAETVFCAEKLGVGGWKAHDYFFDRQDFFMGVSRVEDVTAEYCKDNGADCNAVNACVESQEIKDMIRAMSEEGKAAGIRGTPAVFVNGKLLGLGQMLPVLELTRDSL